MQAQLTVTSTLSEFTGLLYTQLGTEWLLSLSASSIDFFLMCVHFNIHSYSVIVCFCIVMPRCACASEVYGSVFVCVTVCACVRVCMCGLLQLLKDQSSASKSFYRLLVRCSWILICGFAKYCFVLELCLVCVLRMSLQPFLKSTQQTCSPSVATLLSS